MSLLVGLPLKLFHILFVVLRVAWPLLLVWIVWRVIRRHRRTSSDEQNAGKNAEPKFNGPVYTVDYEEVEPDDKEG